MHRSRISRLTARIISKYFSRKERAQIQILRQLMVRVLCSKAVRISRVIRGRLVELMVARQLRRADRSSRLIRRTEKALRHRVRRPRRQMQRALPRQVFQEHQALGSRTSNKQIRLQDSQVALLRTQMLSRRHSNKILRASSSHNNSHNNNNNSNSSSRRFLSFADSTSASY